MQEKDSDAHFAVASFSDRSSFACRESIHVGSHLSSKIEPNLALFVAKSRKGEHLLSRIWRAVSRLHFESAERRLRCFPSSFGAILSGSPDNPESSDSSSRLAARNGRNDREMWYTSIGLAFFCVRRARGGCAMSGEGGFGTKSRKLAHRAERSHLLPLVSAEQSQLELAAPNEPNRERTHFGTRASARTNPNSTQRPATERTQIQLSVLRSSSSFFYGKLLVLEARRICLVAFLEATSPGPPFRPCSANRPH